MASPSLYSGHVFAQGTSSNSLTGSTASSRHSAPVAGGTLSPQQNLRIPVGVPAPSQSSQKKGIKFTPFLTSVEDAEGYGQKNEAAPGRGERRSAQAELEAERLWWSEAAERQVKELEDQFGEEFNKTTGRLRAEIAAVQDRIEMLVATEKKQRHAAFAELKRDLDTQQVTLSEVVQQQSRLNSLESELKNFALRPREGLDLAAMSQVQNAHQSIATLRCDLDISRSQQEAKNAELLAEWAQHKLVVASTEAALADLRRDFAGTQERHSSSGSQLEAIVQELRQDFESLREKTHLQAQSNGEVQALHMVLMQSAGDLGRGIEEVSAAILATDQKLRQEIKETRQQLEAADSRQAREFLEALETSGKQLAQSIARIDQQVADESEKRVQDVSVFNSKLGVWGEQLEELQAATKSATAVMHTQTVPSVSLDDVESLQSRCARLETMISNQTSAERVAPTAAAEAKVREAMDRAERAETTVSRIESWLDEERSLRAAEIAEVRLQASLQCKRAHQASVESAAGRMSSGEERAPALACDGVGAPGVAVEDLEQLRADLVAFKSASGTSLEDLRAELACFKASSQHFEERIRTGLEAATRVEALEIDIRQAARESEVRRLDAEVRNVAKDIAPLFSRLEAAEANARKAVREALPLSARIDAAESEMQRVARDSAPVAFTLEGLRADVETLKARHLAASAAPVTSAAAVTEGPALFHPATQAVRGDVRSSRSPSRPRSIVPNPRARSPQNEVQFPALSDGLKESIHNLVRKVNNTLTTKSEGTSYAADASAGCSTPAASAPAPAPIGGNGCCGGHQPQRTSILDASATSVAHALETPVAQEGFIRALQAVQELREHNLSLREENAELAEELLAQDGLLTPMGSVHGGLPQWPPSAQHSASATPNMLGSQTAQLVAPQVGGARFGTGDQTGTALLAGQQNDRRRGEACNVGGSPQVRPMENHRLSPKACGLLGHNSVVNVGRVKPQGPLILGGAPVDNPRGVQTGPRASAIPRMRGGIAPRR